jgi:hypothetical protein
MSVMQGGPRMSPAQTAWQRGATGASPHMQLRGRAAVAGRAPRDEVPLQVDGRGAQDEPGPGGLVAQHQVRGQQAAHGLARRERRRRARAAGELRAHVPGELCIVVHLRRRAGSVCARGRAGAHGLSPKHLVAKARARRCGAACCADAASHAEPGELEPVGSGWRAGYNPAASAWRRSRGTQSGKQGLGHATVGRRSTAGGSSPHFTLSAQTRGKASGPEGQAPGG